MTRISIIMPLYNSAKFMSRSIVSVLEQIYSDWELILVDDFSFDESFDIARSFRDKDSRIKIYKSAENSGPAVARNLAISMAVGRYITFLDSDDIWLPEKLTTQLSFMQDNEVPFTFSAFDKIDSNGNVIGHVDAVDKIDYSELLKRNIIGCLTVMYDTEYFGKVYMPNILKRQDYALWLKLLKKTDYAYGIKESLAQYRVHENSVSSNRISAALYIWKLYREVESMPYLKSVRYFVNYAFRALMKNSR